MVLTIEIEKLNIYLDNMLCSDKHLNMPEAYLKFMLSKLV